MSDEKRNRLVAAATVNVILLIVIFSAIIIYQLVVMGSMRSKRDALREEITQYEEATEDLDDDLNNRLKAQWYLQLKLIEYGYHY